MTDNELSVDEIRAKINALKELLQTKHGIIWEDLYIATLPGNAPSHNYYRLLGVDFGADTQIIRYAFRHLARKYNPNNEGGSAEMLGLVARAWDTLSDQELRANYDESLLKAHRRDEMHSQCIKILKALYLARQKKPSTGGLSARQLLEEAGRPYLNEIELPLYYLRDKSCIEFGERDFQITAIGIDYLHHYMDDEIPPQTKDPPCGGDPWPPRRDPDAGSPAPRRQHPPDGSSEVSLPEPEPGE